MNQTNDDAATLRPGCGCARCRQARPTRVGEFATMILCPKCGNKRCPKATAHWMGCTGSNEPGQPGSDYGPEYYRAAHLLTEPPTDDATPPPAPSDPGIVNFNRSKVDNVAEPGEGDEWARSLADKLAAIPISADMPRERLSAFIELTARRNKPAWIERAERAEARVRELEGEVRKLRRIPLADVDEAPSCYWLPSGWKVVLIWDHKDRKTPPCLALEQSGTFRAALATPGTGTACGSSG